MEYIDFIKSKKPINKAVGFKIPSNFINSNAFDYQAEIIDRACFNGRYALFVDTGLGKTLMELNYLDAVNRMFNKPVLLVTTLIVAYQIRDTEAQKFGYDVNLCKKQADVKNGINVTNYESIHNFDASSFIAVALDESSILKGFDGKTRKMLTDIFNETRFKLPCTATPSPNDFVELGTHSEFLNNYTVSEMKMMYFTQDRANVQDFILKGHAESEFWEWVASWAECISNPSDLGYDGSRHILPSLNEIYHEIAHDDTKYLSNGSLFEFAETNIGTISKNKRATIEKRADKVAELQNGEPHIVWCHTNDEADVLKEAMPNAIEVRGSHKEEYKAEMALAFSRNEIATLISKESIFGFGGNYQNAHNMTFTGLNYSYESYYQSIRRMWRFGQKNEVNVNIIIADNERNILQSIHRKKEQHEKMKKSMLNAVLKAKKSNGLKIDVFNKFTIPNFIYTKGI